MIKEIVKQSDNLLLTIKRLRKIIFDKFTQNDAKVWLKRLNAHICKCNNLIKAKKLPIGTARKLQSNVGHFKHFRRIILNFNRRVGLGLNSKLRNRVKWENVVSSFASRIKTGVIINLYHKDVGPFLDDAFTVFKQKVKTVLKSNRILKVNTTLWGEFIKKTGDSESLDLIHFNTKNVIIDSYSTDLHIWFSENVKDIIFKKMSEFAEKGSGAALSKVISLEVNINKVEIGNGSSYIKIPEQIQKRHACINIKNYDQNCFYWAIISSLYPAKIHTERTSAYPYYSTALKTEDLEAPMPLSHITKFEKINTISVNVYALELNQVKEKQFYEVVPARLTQNKLDRHVNLLLIQDKYFPKLNDYDAPPSDDENIEIKYHYCWIKDMSRLLSSQLSKNEHKKYICDRCMNYFYSGNKLAEHEEFCRDINKCKMTVPKYDHVAFRNFTYKQTTPFIIYADFECQLHNFTDSNVKLSKTAKYQKHVPYSAGYYFKCAYDDSLSYFRSYRGENCMEWFAKEMAEISKFVDSKIKSIVPMVKKPSTSKATVCHICEKRFLATDIIVVDHDHFTGEVRGFAHQACNLNFRKVFVVPVAFHNFSGYDSHFMIIDLCKHGHLSLLPINKEKYISFTLHSDEHKIRLRFIDTMRFMGASLDELASLLDTSEKKILKQEFYSLDDDAFNLLTCKGVFCYDYVDSLEKLEETSLPTISHFYNKLCDEHISEQKYAHAQKVWCTFECKNLGEYSDLYLKTDILLLADVFEQFRQKCRDTYHLDPAWYYTIPGYTWDCMLRYTKCRLELLKDVDMILFIEKGIRGGISVCSNRFSEANNKYMSTYDPTQPSKYIMYLDVNNLYGWAMSEYLPFGGFKWIEDVTKFGLASKSTKLPKGHIDIMSIPNAAKEGYFFQVDLEYPLELHDKHKDFPFAAEHRIPPGSKQPKLLPTLFNKSKYIIHYRNLKQALSNGLILTKIHKVLKFNQSAWLRPYIELNTNLRAASKSSFEKNLYKMMNNAVFGKTMENIRRHRTVKICKNWNGRYGAKNLIASIRFHSRTIFSENLVAIELTKSVVCFNKPLYIGAAILDISKLCMYDFHYSFMLPTMGEENCMLLYMDTDSFIYELQCLDAYKEVLKAHNSKFDTSDYSENNPYMIERLNKKIPGLMKDEANGKIITNFIGLRSKMYTFKLQTTDEEREKERERLKLKLNKEQIDCGIQNLGITKKAKGVKYNVVKNIITFEDFENCLKEYKIKSTNQRCIRSYQHSVFSIEQTKTALSPYDDKRYLIPESFKTLPWGHCDIP
ncbi:uncharacterized protein LOC126884985 [Diabrotica virgifera virgifera]|uniref:DNA-directed DNA polymerase n=1 Tax=Diabrotica virgifera virgifera TaxID=50390 RepID=A0ABM5JN92_DIAVI|nr:uncharacterized protein LOC126879620 [Diabrotica virgifera virgifera]XP_050498752.1 uncharacterized protein LOC126879620 [Diabrotica virgifera virgifera]XP_050499410.1 uncharacterized protein LOC126879987 [Diabrotica virgifera virgifera]XP_050499411.1 uncharacterized protein LOC126879987 [Diabrotica virgifera virgifera]XP_050507328.1 uncharacterized protein LOC126884985 [Diabrotica virgifera virgifera]XP_050507329.1 uncharacterized protein LOC126884985 [Diabrotica virgifera virgifera]XP_05